MELRLMDDIMVPQHLAQVTHSDRPPSAIILRPGTYAAPSVTQPAPKPTIPAADGMHLATVKSAPAAATSANAASAGENADGPQSSERYTIMVLKSNQVVEVVKYHRDGDYLMIEDTQGRTGSVEVKDVDWRKTSEMTAEVQSVDTPAISRQTH
jgi:hypothetical protein